MAETRQMRVTDWQHKCAQCGYENGFHVSFRRATRDEQGNDVAIVLICPSCSAHFDIGLKTRLSPQAQA